MLFSHIRLLFGETLLLQKINELIKGNQNAQNDYKIFVLIFALIQNSKSPEFCIDKSININYIIFYIVKYIIIIIISLLIRMVIL